MLHQFSSTRRQLKDEIFDRATLTISGRVEVTPANIVQLQALQEQDYLRNARVDGASVDFALLEIQPDDSKVAEIKLCPVHLPYFEDADDLLRRAHQESESYYLHPYGNFRRDIETDNPIVSAFREMLTAKRVLCSAADLADSQKAIFLTPERIEIPFACTSEDLQPLPELAALQGELAPGSVERDQRIALLKRSLRDHLRAIDPPERFGHFLRNFSLIYDTYRRDFLLWIGQAFTDLEKQFEEKRLKFIADLNAILAGIQGSILAVPLATIIVADKFSADNPGKNAFLGCTVTAVVYLAWKLLDNQEYTLNATSSAIESVKGDFTSKYPKRKEEIENRLKTVIDQKGRVATLLKNLRTAIVVILCGTWVAVAVSAFLPAPKDTGSSSNESQSGLSKNQGSIPSPAGPPSSQSAEKPANQGTAQK